MLNHIKILLKHGRIDEAKVYCAHAVEISTDKADTYNVLGNVLFVNNYTDMAIEYFKNALALCPEHPYALNNIGMAVQKNGNINDAITYFKMALELKREFPEALFNLGQAFISVGDIASAEKCLREVLVIRPSFHQAAKLLAKLKSGWLEPLVGNNLILRSCCEEDAIYIHQCLANDNFMNLYNRYMSKNISINDLIDKIRYEKNLHPFQKNSVDWIITDKKNNRIGIANLTEINFKHRRAEFLIGITNTNCNSALRSIEATLLVFDYAFNRIGLHKIISMIYSYNEYAQKNCLSVGFTQEGYLREHLKSQVGAEYYDVYFNGLTEQDFHANKRLAKSSQRLLGRDITRSEVKSTI